MNKLKIGWSEVDITPEKGTKIGLDGQFYDRITDEVESPITVTTLVLDNGTDQIITCSCDVAAAVASVDDSKKSEELKGKTAEQIEVKVAAVDEGGLNAEKKEIEKEKVVTEAISLIITKTA